MIWDELVSKMPATVPDLHSGIQIAPAFVAATTTARSSCLERSWPRNPRDLQIEEC